ncbi:MAG: PLP-dependent lyase/thiolase, partial [Bdellovibrionales bacterium]|nr:PLP-dependent lyase/thiolase [Bdellovibrionales bacterium]
MNFHQLKANTIRQNPFPPRDPFCPEVQIDTIETARGNIFVAREDLLPGGTKQRAIGPYLKQLAALGFERFTYASPFCGFAQVALATCAERLGLSVLIFAEKDQTQTERTAHEFTKLCASYGADIELCNTLSQAEELAYRLAASDPKTFKIPLGFADLKYERAMQIQIAAQLDLVTKNLGFCPRRIWLPVGSGTLSQIFSQVVPLETQLLCVDVGVLATEDSRIQKV